MAGITQYHLKSEQPGQYICSERSRMHTHTGYHCMRKSERRDQKRRTGNPRSVHRFHSSPYPYLLDEFEKGQLKHTSMADPFDSMLRNLLMPLLKKWVENP
jgi:hypothetical protein